jgi:hypothetical protein
VGSREFETLPKQDMNFGIKQEKIHKTQIFYAVKGRLIYRWNVGLFYAPNSEPKKVFF